MSNDKERLAKARDWLVHGGGGHEDGEDGLRALTLSGDSLIEYLADYEEFCVEQLEREWDELREVCGQAYQLAGAYEAPEKALDNLSAASQGKPIPHETFLPVENQWESAIREQVQSAVAAALERAGQLVQDRDGHDPDCPWYYSPDNAHVEGCTCEAKEMADKIRSLITPSQHSALELWRWLFLMNEADYKVKATDLQEKLDDINVYSKDDYWGAKTAEEVRIIAATLREVVEAERAKAAAEMRDQAADYLENVFDRPTMAAEIRTLPFNEEADKWLTHQYALVAAEARLEEGRFWHKKLHWATGVPCDGTWPECKRIAELEKLRGGK